MKTQHHQQPNRTARSGVTVHGRSRIRHPRVLGGGLELTLRGSLARTSRVRLLQPCCLDSRRVRGNDGINRERLRRGFTLIEVMVVLTIIMIVSAIAIPLISGTVVTQRLRRGADAVRAEWNALRMQAITEGRVMVFRAAIGNDAILVDAVLDPHFIATLSTESRYDISGRLRRDTLTSEELSANDDGTILKSADTTRNDLRTRSVTLPSNVFTADVITLPDDRTAFVLGATLARGLDSENSLQYEEVAQDEIRFGESAGSDGKLWSAPILFFPDGSTSTAAVLIKGDSGRCIEVRLRGINGATTICPITSSEQYVGEMNATMTRSLD